MEVGLLHAYASDQDQQMASNYWLDQRLSSCCLLLAPTTGNENTSKLDTVDSFLGQHLTISK